VQELFDFSIAFARQPLLQNDRIAIVTNAGGPGIMATDACELAGLQLAPLEAETMASLRSFLPAAASVLNPVDVLGDARADRYERTLRQVLNDPNVGGVIVIVTPQVMTQVEETARVVGQLSKSHGGSPGGDLRDPGERKRPILGCFMGSEAVARGIRILNEHAVPNYPVPERAVAAMAAMMAQRRWRARPEAQPETFAVDQDRVRHALQRVKDEGRVAMGDAEAWEILEAYGIATPKTGLARSPDEAVHLAEEIGFPVAVKIASPDILHKTDVGGVQLNVVRAADVRKAYEQMIYRAGQYVPNAEIWGCQVQEMIIGGKEVIVGMHRDPVFGPLMMFGLGGIYVEALRDVAFRVAPFDRREAREMISEIRASSVFRGVRGGGASDLEALAEALLRLSQLAVDFPEILEFDINPVTVFEEGHGLVGIDPRLVLG
jgi:acetyltransferase